MVGLALTVCCTDNILAMRAGKLKPVKSIAADSGKSDEFAREIKTAAESNQLDKVTT